MDSPLDGQNLDLTYPCPWTYKVFGRDEDSLRTAIAPIVGELEHTIRFSNRSRSGKYVTLELEVTVPSDERRLGIYRELHEHEAVVYLL
jgi:uncharacterized protein